MTIFKGKGVRNFEKCQTHTLPEVNIDTMAYGLDFFGYLNGRLAGPGAKAERLVSTKCPKVGEYVVSASNSTASEAIAIHAKTIGAEVCKNCVFARMTPLEAAQYQMAVLDAQVPKSEGPWQQPLQSEQAPKQLPPSQLR